MPKTTRPTAEQGRPPVTAGGLSLSEIRRDVREAEGSLYHATSRMNELLRYMYHSPDRETEMLFDEAVRERDRAEGRLEGLRAKLADAEKAWRTGRTA